MATAQLFSRANKLVQSLHADVAQLESGKDVSVGLQGSVSAALGNLDRTIKDCQELVYREMESERREEGKQHLSILKEEYTSLRRSFDTFKKKEQDKQRENKERQELMASNGKLGSQTLERSASQTLEDYMVKEDQSLQRSIHMVDDYMKQGQESLAKLREQGFTLKNAQRRILDVANTLGLSQTTIRWIERRTAEDKYIFWGGVFLTLTVMFFTIRYIL